MRNHSHGSDHAFGVSVLEGVAADGGAGGARGQRALHHLEELLVGFHLLAASDDHRHRAALDDLAEALGRAGVVHLDDISAELGAYAGGVFDVAQIVLPYLFAVLATTRVHHRQEGHSPGHAARGDLAEIAEHVGVGGGAEVDVDGDSIRPQLDRLLHRAHQYFSVRVRGK